MHLIEGMSIEMDFSGLDEAKAQDEAGKESMLLTPFLLIPSNYFHEEVTRPNVNWRFKCMRSQDEN